MKIPLLKQSDGRESVSFTMMVVGFIVITLWLLVSIVETIFGIPVREFDSGQAMAYFTPIATLYFSRRWTDAHYTAPTAKTAEPKAKETTVAEVESEEEEESVA